MMDKTAFVRKQQYHSHRRSSSSSSSILVLAMTSVSSNNNNNDSESQKEDNNHGNKKKGRKVFRIHDKSNNNATSSASVIGGGSSSSSRQTITEMELTMLQARMTKLEALVAKQQMELEQLKRQCAAQLLLLLADDDDDDKLAIASASSSTLRKLISLLKEEEEQEAIGRGAAAGLDKSAFNVSSSNDAAADDPSSLQERVVETSSKDDDNDDDELKEQPQEQLKYDAKQNPAPTVEYYKDDDDDSDIIFGKAPSSVIDAADAAGAAILAGMLGGKHRMLVDVRDAELSRDPEMLVQFIELAILPVAAGLEGLESGRNRVKIVFPTVSQLLEYRRTMALAAPEVVALSTLGFDPVEKMDNLVVLVAPSPDDEEGLLAMNELLEPTDPSRKPIDQPLVVLNYHMVPVFGLAASFEVAYHLRLLSVQFMTGNNAPEYFPKWEEDVIQRHGKDDDSTSSNVLYGPDGQILPMSSDDASTSRNETEDASDKEDHSVPEEDDAALEAAMKHAHDIGINQGVTRAMVIRAYPRPWHVFVDTSPDTDADFEVAATFDDEPSQDDVNYAIVECLEGSEIEDELVAQQMQQALESGQLDRVSEMLEQISGMDVVADESEDQPIEGDGHDKNEPSGDSFSDPDKGADNESDE